MNVDYGNAFGGVNLPQNPQSGGNGGGNRTPVDYDKVNAAILEAHGGEGKQLRIGVITNIYDLGTQDQDEQTILVSDKDYSKHEWRLEIKEDGSGQKDPTASLTKRKIKNVVQDVLVCTPPPVKQIAVTVDLPEVMFDYSVYSGGGEPSIKPYRIILGEEGFIPKGKTELAGTYNLIAKPFKLSHTNVNRGIEGAKPHYAMAKISQIYKLADWTGVLGADENFHADEVGKLIGKAVMVEVETQIKKWQAKDGSGERSKLVVDAKVTGKLGPRDVPFYESELKPKLTQDLFGFVRFDTTNDEDTLKKIRASVINTMKLSPEFESSVLKSQLEKLGKLGDSSAPVVNNTPQKASQEEYTPPQQSVSPQEQKGLYNEPPMDFDDNIPF